MRMREVLAAIDRLPFGTLDQIAGSGALVVLAPHPDDETLGCGGLIAAAHAKSQHVEVIILTDGSGSHRHSPSYPPDRLAALRRSEVISAVETLGLPPHRLTFLDLPDARAPTCGPDFDRAVTRIVAVLARTGAETLFVTWRHDPHCDHEAAAVMAAAAVAHRPRTRLWHYPIWGLHRPPDAETSILRPTGFRLDITPLLPIKRAAIACHASQMTDLIADDPDGFHFDEAMLAPFLQPVERFLEAAP